MVEKVLVADDSLTIQKVVGITLADTSYEIEKCLTEEELLDKIQSNYYNLILLDFSFSEKMSGYELAKSVANASPDSAILAMLGTFDTVDENELIKSGVLDKVVKPFESEKFIKKCQSLMELTVDGTLDATALEDNSFDDEIVDTQEEEISLGDGWIVDSPKPEDSSFNKENDEVYVEEESVDSRDALSSEMEGWAIQVPGIIGEEEASNYGIFPPVIEDDNVISLVQPSDLVLEEGAELIEQLESKNEVETLFESDNDLSPVEETEIFNDESIDESRDDLSQKEKTEIHDRVEPQFDSIDELSPVEETVSFDEETDAHIQMPEEFTAEIETEIEDLGSPDDFWAVEGGSSLASRYAAQEAESVSDDSLDKEIEPSVENISVSQVSPAVDEQAMIEQITNSITPMIEDMVRHFCQQKIEQIAWEVIPDLAENIIKKELKELADSVRS